MSNHYNPLLIVGPSGSGKSTSLRNLNPETTAILNVERKPLPFRQKFPHTIAIDAAPKLNIEIDKALKDDNIKVIVVESLTEWMRQHKNLCKQLYQGFDIFGNYADGVFKLLDKIKNITEKFVVVISHDEFNEIISKTGELATTRTAAIWEGKKLVGKVEPNFTTVLFTAPVKNKEGRLDYRFSTQSDGVTTAKSPFEMLPEFMPNDVNEVLKKAAEYWGLAYKGAAPSPATS